MAKAMNFIVGAALLLLGFISIIGRATDFMFFAVVGVGIIILFLPMVGGHGAGGNIRRWIFGIFLVICGLGDFLYEVLPMWIGEWLAFIRYSSYLGSIIVMFIGAIYFFSAFARMRTLNLATE